MAAGVAGVRKGGQEESVLQVGENSDGRNTKRKVGQLLCVEGAGRLIPALPGGVVTPGWPRDSWRS